MVHYELENKKQKEVASMKRFLSLVLTAALALSLVPTALAASGVTTASGVGSGGQLVYVDMTGRTGDVVIGASGLNTDSPASSMVAGSMAAINGGFFNSYYSGAGNVFPSNCAQVYGAVTMDGQIINAGGSNNMIAFTYDGDVLIDRVKVATTAVVSGKANVSVWGVNQLYSDATGVSLMTDDMKLSYTTAAGATVFTIQNDKIIAVGGAGTYTTPAGCQVLIYNSGFAANAAKYKTLPAKGDTVRFAYQYVPTDGQNGAAWTDIKTAVTGGRMLVQDGKNVTAVSSYNAQYDSDSKQSNTSSGQRSFAAVMKDGRLLLGTADGTFPAIANDLIALGAVSAVSLDGGASSMLYANGKTLTPAGRELAVVLTVVPQNPNEKPYVNPSIPQLDLNPNNPSSWAAADVAEASSLGLIPSWLQYNYRSPITREEFCDTLMQLIPAVTGKTPDQIRGELGVVGSEFDKYTFTDTSKYSIRLAAALGIVTGVGNGKFAPKNTLTREQAATMMQRAANLMGTVEATKSPTFSDAARISSWAVDGVQFVTSCGIMNGTGTAFNPQGTYTREQTYITMLNAYKAIIPNG